MGSHHNMCGFVRFVDEQILVNKSCQNCLEQMRRHFPQIFLRKLRKPLTQNHNEIVSRTFFFYFSKFSIFIGRRIDRTFRTESFFECDAIKCLETFTGLVTPDMNLYPNRPRYLTV